MTTLRIGNPDKPRRAHAAVYRRMHWRVPDWLLWVCIGGLMFLPVIGWNLRMGVWHLW